MQERGVSVEGRLLISDRAHLLFDLHKEIDAAREAELAGTGERGAATRARLNGKGRAGVYLARHEALHGGPLRRHPGHLGAPPACPSRHAGALILCCGRLAPRIPQARRLARPSAASAPPTRPRPRAMA